MKNNANSFPTNLSLKEGVRLIMTRASRAKQFLPFDALSGFKEALKEKEIKKEAKIELSEDSLQELENKLNELEKGSIIKLTYYKNNRYIETIGIITKIDYLRKKIILSHDAEDENILNRKNSIESSKNYANKSKNYANKSRDYIINSKSHTRNGNDNTNEIINVCDIIEIEKIN